MTKLHSIGVLSLAKLMTALMTLIGLIMAIIYSFGGAIYDLTYTGAVNLGTALAFFALIGMPLCFGLCGFIIGITSAYAYNLAAKRLGGIELYLKESE